MKCAVSHSVVTSRSLRPDSSTYWYPWTLRAAGRPARSWAGSIPPPAGGSPRGGVGARGPGGSGPGAEPVIREGQCESHVVVLHRALAKVTATMADGRQALLSIRVS